MVEEVLPVFKSFACNIQLSGRQQQLDAQEIFGVAGIFLFDLFKCPVCQPRMFMAKSIDKEGFVVGRPLEIATCFPES